MMVKHYSTVIFDCDGVLLDSNRIKTEAFRVAALPWGPRAVEALVAHHVAHGGVSRYEKFSHFLSDIVPAYDELRIGVGLEALVSSYAQAVRQGLMDCIVAPGLSELRAAAPNARWMIVSGGDQEELRMVFAARDLAQYFDGGIFGSPDTKDTILAREIDAGNIIRPAVFLGDSRLDHEAASGAGLDFVFVANWSEWEDGEQIAAQGRFHMVKSLTDLLET